MAKSAKLYACTIECAPNQSHRPPPLYFCACRVVLQARGHPKKKKEKKRKKDQKNKNNFPRCRSEDDDVGEDVDQDDDDVVDDDDACTSSLCELRPE